MKFTVIVLFESGKEKSYMFSIESSPMYDNVFNGALNDNRFENICNVKMPMVNLEHFLVDCRP